MKTSTLLGLACAAVLGCANQSEPPPAGSGDARETVVQLRLLALEPRRELVIGWGDAPDPNDAEARLDGVYALIQQRRFDAAVVELERLLREDLPRFGPRLRDDGRLAPLHESAYANELERVHAEVAAAYREALLEGVTAWVGQPSCAPTGPYSLRQGVWVPRLERFIPLSPELADAVGGLLDVPGGRLLMLSAVFAASGAHARAPVELGVHVYDLDALGVPIQAVEDLGAGRPELTGSRQGVRATLVENDVHLTFLDYDGDGERSVTVEAGVARLLQQHVDQDAAHIAIDGDVVSLHPPTVTHPRVMDEGLYTDEFEIELCGISPPHHIPKAQHIEETPSGRYILVLSHYTQTFEGDVPFPLHYALSRVQRQRLGGRWEELLAQGSGWTWASLGADGSVYFENYAGHLWRYPPNSASPIWDLPEWVQVRPPCRPPNSSPE